MFVMKDGKLSEVGENTKEVYLVTVKGSEYPIVFNFFGDMMKWFESPEGWDFVEKCMKDKIDISIAKKNVCFL